VKMECRQRMMAVAGFTYHNAVGALLQCCPESGSRRRIVIYWKDAYQANSFRRWAMTLVASRAAGVA